MFKNPTQALGFFAFLSAALSCISTIFSKGTQAEHRWWTTLGLFYVCLTTEIMCGGRFMLHDHMATLLRQSGQYEVRRNFQTALLGVSFAFILTIGTWLAVKVRHKKIQLKYAFASTYFLIGVFITEAISLHVIDAIFYTPIASVLIVGWLWLLCAITTVVAALWSRHASARN